MKELPDPTDTHVGNRVRIVTFQQVQKYEKGTKSTDARHEPNGPGRSQKFFMQITDPNLRRRLVNLVEAIAGGDS